jgi:hypothetical protein
VVTPYDRGWKDDRSRLRLLTAVRRALDRCWALALEYLIKETCILRPKLPRRVSLADAERRRLGRSGTGSALAEYVEHFHHERNHQGLGNGIPAPRLEDRIGASDGRIERRRRLGGLLNFYCRRAG